MENNTDKQLRESELYWNETVKPNLPTHSKDFILPAWVIDFADQYGRHVRQQSLSELSEKDIAISELKIFLHSKDGKLAEKDKQIEELKAQSQSFRPPSPSSA